MLAILPFLSRAAIAFMKARLLTPSPRRLRLVVGLGLGVLLLFFGHQASISIVSGCWA